MPLARRLTVPIDRATYDLVAVTKAVWLAGDRALPTASAKTAWYLARGIRSAFEGGAEDLAKVLMAELAYLLGQANEENSSVIGPIMARLTALDDRIEAQNRLEASLRTPALPQQRTSVA